MDYDASVIEVLQRGVGYLSVRFERPARFSYTAGQYCILTLGEGMVHAFTISSPPSEPGFIEFTTRLSDSVYKKRLAGLSPGDAANIRGPLGAFTLRAADRKVVFLAGGVGVTPFRSICKWAADSGVDDDIVLLVGVKTLEDAVFREEFETMSSESLKMKVVYVPNKPPPGWPGWSGYITADIIRHEAPDHQFRTFYLCGPPLMVEAMEKILDGMRIPKDKVIVERFSGY